MLQDSKLGVGAEASVDRGGEAKVGLQFENRWKVECFGPDGRLKWVEEIDNLVVNEGLNSNLNVYLGATAKIATWYVGLIDNAGFTAIAAGDTAAQINGSNGWSELGAYSEAVRQTFTPGVSTAQSLDNSASKAVFNMNATAVVNGAFLVSSDVKAGTTGTLYGAASFSSVKNVDNGDTLNVTVTATAQAA